MSRIGGVIQKGGVREVHARIAQMHPRDVARNLKGALSGEKLSVEMKKIPSELGHKALARQITHDQVNPFRRQVRQFG